MVELRRWRLALLASSCALGAPALAQTAPVPAPVPADVAAAEALPGETIVVTGSRIRRDANLASPAPVSTLSQQGLQATGQVDATAALREIPALLASASVADSLERGGRAGIGQAVLNLRQLGNERTLVLVDGRRHVGGVAGESTVDVATIPSALIERVEVFTGGASAVYGADAVTGVVNYILREDFEGAEVDGQVGLSSEGDGRTARFGATIGRNFGGGRGNITLSGGIDHEDEVLLGDRSFTANNGRANNSLTYSHPDRRFQRGDINPATMPNFGQRFSVAAGRFPLGFAIPTRTQFNSFFPGQTPTPAEQALIDRAANAPLFQIAPDPRFAISSGEGLIFRADFDFFDADINNNGINDCRESYIGLTGFGGGGCYVTNPDGTVRIFRDGIVATGQNQFGGDGTVERTNTTSLTPGSQRVYAVLRGRYTLAPAAELFWDAKYVRSESISRDNYNTFYDSLLLFADNPFIPAVLQDDADDAGGLRISRDFLDLGPGITETQRDLYRIVGGLRGELAPGLRYDLAGNWGRQDNAATFSNTVRPDRLFAAVDAVRAPDGRIVCRSDLDPTARHPGSEIFPVIPGGFFTFRPGDGQCRPANILRGEQSLSPEAVAFITTPTTNTSRIEQFVVTGYVSGDSNRFLNLPGGPIGFVVGGEYREERSRQIFNDLELGIVPEGGLDAPAGTFIGDTVTGLNQLSFDGQTRTFNTSGKFDVKEVFGELLVPILAQRPFFEELSLEGAARYADYSTIGGAFTWMVKGAYAPVRDVRLRGTYSEAIRAPNIFELFSPQQGATFRPADPCDQDVIERLLAGGAANAQNRLANCRADGVPDGFRDPLTARFSGTTGGNPDLTEERARTWTAGAVIQPRFVPGLTLSGDYYNISISDAIAPVTAQDIVNTCYDLANFPNLYCDLFTRNRTPGSGTFLGLNFLRQTRLNFGRIETSGVDFNANWNLPLWAENRLILNVAGNWTEKLNRFFDPADDALANPALREFSVPEWSGVGSATFVTGPLSLTWRTQYIDRQAIASVVQIERVDIEFGPAGIADPFWIHGAAFNFEVDRRFSLYGGVNNLTNERPLPASSAYPVSGIGRFMFLGLRGRF